jgi:hypothetical protein
MRVVAAMAFVILVGCSGPASQLPSAPTTADPFAAVKAAPLKLPHLAVGHACPETGARDLGDHLGVAFGDGPVYVLGGADLQKNVHANVGHPCKVAWGAAPIYTGPIRIRGGRLDAAGQLLLDGPDNRWRGAPVKRVDGSDLVSELDFLESHSIFPNVPTGWRIWPSGTYVPVPGCYAWQVDGNGFTYMITIQI